MAKKSRLKSYVSLVPFFLIQIVWGSYFLIAKNLQQEINVYFLHALRFTLLSVLLFPFAAKHLKDKKVIIPGVISGLLLSGNNYLLNIGLNYSTAVNASFLIGVAVIFIAIIEMVVFKARMEKMRVISTLIAAVGMWFITGGVSGIDVGDGILIVSAMLGAFHVIYMDKILVGKLKILPNLFWQMFVSAVVGFILNIFFGSFVLPTVTLPLTFEFLYLTLVSMGLGMVIQMWTQSRVNPVVIGVVGLFQSIFGAIIAWTIGGEAFIPMQALGGVIILIAIFLSIVSDKDANLKSLD